MGQSNYNRKETKKKRQKYYKKINENFNNRNQHSTLIDDEQLKSKKYRFNISHLHSRNV